MGNEWSLIKLKDIVDISTTKISVDDVLLINYISTENMLPDFGDIQLASSKPADGKISVYKKGDILFSNIRTYFKKLWLADRDGGCSNDVIVFRPKKEISAGYVYHLLMDQKFIDYASKTSKGTKMPRGDKGAIMEYSFSLAPKLIREAISNRLLTIKSKITLNRQINQTLEQMAQTLFKSWFVDFDPVIDNALDAGNEIPEVLQARAELRQKVRASQDFQSLPADVRELFPTEFEDSELGWVPKGWTVSTVGKHMDFQNGYAFKSEDLIQNPDNAYPVFKMGNIKRGGGFNPDGTKSYFLQTMMDEKITKFFIKKGDLLMSMTDMKSNMAILGNTALMPDDNKYLQNQRVGRLRQSENAYISYPYMYFYTNDSVVVDELRSRANSGVQVNLTSDAIKCTLLLVPNEKVHNIFDNQVRVYLERIFKFDEEILSLSKLRDTLLPKLISGELRLDDLPDEVVAAANE